MITSAGVGSGLDVESIISGLMSLERQPLNNLKQKQSALDVKISGLGKLRSAISDLRDAAKNIQDRQALGHFLAESSNEDVITATATSMDVAETHQIRVISLATRHRLASELYGSGDDAIANGTYTFGAGGNTFDVEIDDTNNTVGGLKSAINLATDNAGVNASMINVDGGTRLVLTAAESGKDNEITAPGWFSEITKAEDAEFEIDGFTATSSSNTVTDVVPGLTLELKQPSPVTDTDNQGKPKAWEEITVSTRSDKEGMLESMNTFVDAYNSLNDIMDNLGDGDLKGEGLMRSIESSVRQQFFTSAEDAIGVSHVAFDFGLHFNKEGTLRLDETEFNSAVDEKFQSMMSFFTAEDGFGQKMANALEAFTASDGILDSRKDGFNSRKDSLDNQMERLEYRLENVEKRYRTEFTTLDTLMSQLGTTSSYMTQQLASLPFTQLNR